PCSAPTLSRRLRLSTPLPALPCHSGQKPLAPPRHLTPGWATMPRGAPTPTLLIPLRGLFVSRPSPRPPGRACVPGSIPPQPTTALLAPVTPVRQRVRQRWRAAIGGPEPVVKRALVSSAVPPTASPRP